MNRVKAHAKGVPSSTKYSKVRDWSKDEHYTNPKQSNFTKAEKKSMFNEIYKAQRKGPGPSTYRRAASAKDFSMRRTNFGVHNL